jgi:hypothetical protein
LNSQRNAPASPRVEDLSAVLGKFRVWDEMQRQSAEADKLRQDQVREVGYEQALNSISRYRRTTAPGMQQELPAQDKPRPESATESATVDRVQQMPKSAASRAAKAEKRQTDASKRLTRKPTPAPAEKERGGTKSTRSSPARRRQPSFATAVKRELAVQEKWGQSAVETSREVRDAALTIRLTAQEMELIRSRAAEAKISVSGYLRQCALGFEVLRKHVEGVLAEMRVVRQAAAHEGQDQNAVPPTAVPVAKVMRKSLINRFRSTLARALAAIAGATASNESGGPRRLGQQGFAKEA